MEIKGINDFLEKCLSLERNLPKDPGKKRVLFFRGETQEHPRLMPSIYQPNFNVRYEDTMFKEIIATFPDEMLAKKTTIEKLIFMRHQELPTRVLDISKNPLVGLFFACYREHKTEPDKDGRVYVFSVLRDEINFCESDSVCLIANICKRPAGFSIKQVRHLKWEEFNKSEPMAYLLHDVRQDKPDFQPQVELETLESVICLHPLMNNERIRRQAGYFFLFGIKGDKTECAELNPDWIVEKIRIPGKAKAQILKELDFLNINESSLYADYQHLSKGLQEKYRQWKQ